LKDDVTADLSFGEPVIKGAEIRSLLTALQHKKWRLLLYDDIP
jgi:hypothetical protein